MAISDEKRQAVSKLALKALDTIEEQYGEDAELGDAVIVYDVITPDPDDPDGSPISFGHYHSTATRTTIISGLLRQTELYLSTPDPKGED